MAARPGPWQPSGPPGHPSRRGLRRPPPPPPRPPPPGGPLQRARQLPAPEIAQQRAYGLLRRAGWPPARQRARARRPGGPARPRLHPRRPRRRARAAIRPGLHPTQAAKRSRRHSALMPRAHATQPPHHDPVKSIIELPYSGKVNERAAVQPGLAAGRTPVTPAPFYHNEQHAVRRPHVSARRRARASQQQQGVQERGLALSQRGARRCQLCQPGVRGERAQAQRGQRCGAVQRARARTAAPGRARAQRQRACASRASVYTYGSALGRSAALRLPRSCAARGRLCTQGVQRRRAQGCRRPAAAPPGDPACPAPPSRPLSWLPLAPPCCTAACCMLRVCPGNAAPPAGRSVSKRRQRERATRGRQRRA